MKRQTIALSRVGFFLFSLASIVFSRAGQPTEQYIVSNEATRERESAAREGEKRLECIG